MPLVSVIVPVHNGEANLRSCLRSIVGQTLRDIEIIMVDDRSTDGTLGIIQEFAKEDSRVRCVTGPGVQSAGAARNVGLDLATGGYLAFLDADDFFAPTMLEELHTKAVDDSADVVLTKFRVVDQRTGDAVPADWAVRLQYFPPRTPVTPDELGDHLFYAVNPAAWNKLFRAEFIRETGLRFQHLKRTNDVYFTYMALALSSRISCVEAYLVDYRVGNSGSLQGSLHESPLEFVQALDELHEHLQKSGLLPKLERAFVNEAVEICMTNLRKVTTAKAFVELHHALRADIFSRFGILDRPAEFFLRDDLANQVRAVVEQTSEELLFARMNRANDAAAKAKTEARQTLREMEVRAQALILSSPARDEAPAEANVAEGPSTDGNSRPDVSVVIPVHNTESFLHECLSSVQSQTGVTLEVICVDDGSTDASGSVLDQLAKADARVTVIHQANAGPSVARNRGLSAATGRYVCFLDSDDYWREDGLADLVRRADGDRLDMLLFDAISLREPGVDDGVWDRFRKYYERSSYEGVRTGPELLAAMRAATEYRASPCLYLVRAEFLAASGCRFYPGIAHEDNLFTFELMLGAHRAVHTQTALYARRMRPGSLMTAGAKEFSARGYLITYLEMLRLAGRGTYDDRVATQVGAIIYSAFRQARDNFVRVNTDVGDRLLEVDPEAQAAVLLLKRLRYEAQFGRGTAKAKAAPKKQPRSFTRRMLSRGKRFAERVLGRGGGKRP